MADYKSVIRSPTFSFLVGKQRSCLSVHAGALQNVSEPLWAMVDNGQMKESTSRAAVLDDTDEDVFIGFCEHVYTETYATPGLESTAVTNQTLTIPIHSSSNFENVDQPDIPANDTPPIEDDWIIRSKGKVRRKKWGCPEELEPQPYTRNADSGSCYEKRWQKFRTLKFKGLTSSLATKPDILFHAKLYIFATRYIIESLQAQAVKSLHRDLCTFTLNKETAPQIISLLEFTYRNTARYEPSGRSLLRDVVIQYVSCEMQVLADNNDLYSLLDVDGEMGSDLVAKLMK
ncbi:hypothetical protein LOZ66_006843 [Ophidiomyces ophidiicola]|nr:hypothetical protein LOZ66_006843 [Ophidiomyces ophidiicola]